jgi:hypothetical protein
MRLHRSLEVLVNTVGRDELGDRALVKAWTWWALVWLTLVALGLTVWGIYYTIRFWSPE